MTTRPTRRGYHFVQAELKARATRTAKRHAAERAANLADPAKAKAQQILDKIRGGMCVFHKGPTGWVIAGPADEVRRDRCVDVTKVSGAARPVLVTSVLQVGEKQGVAYAYATFAEVAGSHNAPRARAAARRVHSDAFGPGVQYGDGATVYTGPGGGRTQIWDD